MRLILAFLLFSLSLVNSQISLQGNYNEVFSSIEDVGENGQDSKLIRSKAQDVPQSRFRLSNTVLPNHYEVKISPIIDDGQALGPRWTTPGEVVINITCQQATSVINLHSKDINITETRVMNSGGANLGIVSQVHDDETSFYNITVGTVLQPGQNYTIHLTFESLISVALNGLYRSSYTDPDTQEVEWLATTQMEALHARQLFPCFDEPSLKATFDVTIGRRDIHLALFNTESLGNTTMEGVAGWVWEAFAPTVVMPTYLLAIIISKFTYSESTENALVGKTVRTYAPKHYIDDNGGIYAANLADKMLAYFEEYYAQEYPLQKMDSAAVPDFFFGAMENWGLNIYRETALLYFEGESNEAERFTVTRILGHELAHQWFGNLVTAHFWTHIWLNEGFATYVAAQVVDVLHPEYQAWERFQNDAVQAAMVFDARAEVTHSVKIDEDDWPTKDAMSWFDRISYEKGGSLIRMMQGFLTEDTLQRGLRRYLEAKKYQGAMQDELFSNLDIDAQNDNRLPQGMTIKEIMDTWTLQPHFPLLRVTRAGTNRIFISQEIFSNNMGQQPSPSRELDPNDMWHVPVSIATQDNPNFNPMPDLWIEKNIALTSHPVNTTQWLIANAGATGYYRVLYDTVLTNLITQQLIANHEAINSSVTRSQLHDDYLTAAFQRYINIETALPLTRYLGNEVEIVVWNTVFNQLRKASYLISDNSLRSYLQPKVSAAFLKVGGPSGDVQPGMPTLRHVQFLDWICALEAPECEVYVKGLYDQWVLTPLVNPVRLDNRPVVYCAMVATGGQEAFDFIKARYLDTTLTAKQRGFLLNALGCAKDISIIDGILENILQAGYDIPVNVRGTLLQRLSMNALARPRVLQHFRTNAEAINTFFGSINVITNSISTMSTYMGTTADLDTVQTFKTENAALIGAAIDGPIRIIEENIQWMSEFGNRMSAYFTANAGS